MTKDRLLMLCKRVIKDYPPHDNLTFCNFAVQSIANEYGCLDFNAQPNANTMYDILDKSDSWAKILYPVATLYACSGRFVVAAKKYPGHGHVAVVAPLEPEWSGSFGCLLPVVANVGKTNGFMRVSQAFPVSEGLPDFYLWNQEN